MKPFVLALCVSLLVVTLACLVDGIRPVLRRRHHVDKWTRGRQAKGDRHHRNNRKNLDQPKWKESEKHEKHTKKGGNEDRVNSRGSGGWFQSWHHRHHRPHRFEIGIGHSPENSWFNFDFDFGRLFNEEMEWWKGPHVCTDRFQRETNETGEGEIRRHSSVHSKICDQTDTTYKCVTTIDIFGKRQEYTEIKECCHGYTRESGERGCTKRLDLKNLVTTAENLDLVEFLRAVDSVGMRPELKHGNFTIFAPVNQAFLSEPNLPQSFPLPEDQVSFSNNSWSLVNNSTKLAYQDLPESNLVLVSRPLTDMLVNDMKQLLLGHVVVGSVKTSQMKDEQTLPTGSPVKSTVRINFYEYPHKLITANCARLLKTDVLATNGVIHTVERVLSPVTNSLIGIISKNPELSTLKTLLSKGDLVQMLREYGHYTLFAPTNSAFDKLPMELQEKLYKGDACLKNILLHHLLPRVICSAVIDERVRTANMLDKYMGLTRDDNDKIFAEGVQVTGTDLMATNGVLHLVDEVIIPDDALSILEVAEKNGAKKVVEFIQRAKIADKLNNLENLTMFAPNDKAFDNLDERVLEAVEMDPQLMEQLLTFHVAENKLPITRLHNDDSLSTLHTSHNLRVNEYSTFPFGNQWVKTVQCAAISKHNLKACNGIVHIIDQVMRPPEGTVLDVIKQNREFSTLHDLLEKAGLAEMLEGEGPFTVLAPTNLALEDIGDVQKDTKRLKAVLKNHIIRDTVCCSGIFGGQWFLRQQLRTSSGETFPMDRSRDNGPKIGNAFIKSCDLMATNGVVQTMDRVLVKRHQVDANWREREDSFKSLTDWGDFFRKFL
ncbi:LOW QUALITY PROTEIN: periostin-like [Liolophura sinensis]|uniref:LOW QUALITY PROTEIN: periostin-like n=1 Tax=Liolophura sinensis TaxID=3198878 RepID=UPI003158B6C4